MQHLAREAPGLGIVLAGMIGGQEVQVVGEMGEQPVAEAWAGRGQGEPQSATGPQTGSTGDMPQGQQETCLTEQPQCGESGALAGGGLLRRRLVRWRSTVSHLRNRAIVPLQRIVALR